MTDDLPCPNCGDGRAKLLPIVGDREDYKCPLCGAFSISGSDKRRLENGARITAVTRGQIFMTTSLARRVISGMGRSLPLRADYFSLLLSSRRAGRHGPKFCLTQRSSNAVCSVHDCLRPAHTDLRPFGEVLFRPAQAGSILLGQLGKDVPRPRASGPAALASSAD